MAIIKQPNTPPEAGGLTLKFDNGDLTAIQEALAKYGFIGEEALFRFALYVLLRAEKNSVLVDQGDKKVILTPADELIKKK